MARKREVLPPTAPLLCDHITFKTNTTSNIGVQCFVFLTISNDLFKNYYW